MNTRRRRILVFLACILLGGPMAFIGSVQFYLSKEGNWRVTPESFKLIHKGMSKDEVYALLGPPDEGPVRYSNVHGAPPELWANRVENCYWVGRHCSIAVEFLRDSQQVTGSYLDQGSGRTFFKWLKHKLS